MANYTKIVIPRTRWVWLPAWIGYCLAFTVIGLFYGIWKTIELLQFKQWASGEDGIVVEDGLFKKTKMHIRLSDIQSLTIEQHPIEKILGYGDIMALGPKGTYAVLRMVPEPEVHLEQLTQLIKQHQ